MTGALVRKVNLMTTNHSLCLCPTPTLLTQLTQLTQLLHIPLRSSSLYPYHTLFNLSSDRKMDQLTEPDFTIMDQVSSPRLNSAGEMLDLLEDDREHEASWRMDKGKGKENQQFTGEMETLTLLQRYRFLALSGDMN